MDNAITITIGAIVLSPIVSLMLGRFVHGLFNILLVVASAYLAHIHATPLSVAAGAMSLMITAHAFSSFFQIRREKAMLAELRKLNAGR